MKGFLKPLKKFCLPLFFINTHSVKIFRGYIKKKYISFARADATIGRAGPDRDVPDHLRSGQVLNQKRFQNTSKLHFNHSVRLYSSNKLTTSSNVTFLQRIMNVHIA